MGGEKWEGLATKFGNLLYIILDDFVKYDRFPASVVKHSKTCGGKNENAKVPSRTANCRVSSRWRHNGADERRSRVCGSTPAHERGFFYLNRRRHPPEWGGSDPLRGFSVSSQGVVARRDHFYGGFFHLRKSNAVEILCCIWAHPQRWAIHLECRGVDARREMYPLPCATGVNLLSLLSPRQPATLDYHVLHLQRRR